MEPDGDRLVESDATHLEVPEGAVGEKRKGTYSLYTNYSNYIHSSLFAKNVTLKNLRSSQLTLVYALLHVYCGSQKVIYSIRMYVP